MEFPDDGYRGDDIKVLAKEFCDANGAEVLSDTKEAVVEKLVAFGLEKNIARMQ